jgi:hypothetical protein
MTEIDLLLSKNAAERTSQIEFLAAGKARDFAEYKHICGVIRGLNLADEHLRDLAERIKKANDDD